MKKKKGRMKALIIILVIIAALGIGGNLYLRSLGRVTMPKFEKIADGVYAYSEALKPLKCGMIRQRWKTP